MSRKPIEFRDFPADLHPGFGPYSAIVKHIVDGDTFDLLIDAGLQEYPYVTARLLGYDAPETNRLATRAAGLAAKAFVEEVMPVGSPVQVRTAPDPDSFGRWLVRVALLSGYDLGKMMENAGHVVPMIRNAKGVTDD